MQRCNRCGVMMITGTHYEGRHHIKYSECPVCHERINGKVEDNDKIKGMKNT